MFRDREDAGIRLARLLTRCERRPGGLVLGIPRGGAVVGARVASELSLPFDVFISLKLRAPWNPDLAMGAAAESGHVHVNDALLQQIPVPGDCLCNEVRDRTQEVERRRELYRAGRPLPDLQGRTLFVVDDGAVTGSTLRGALRALRGLKPARLIAAVPVCLRGVSDSLLKEADEVVSVFTPRHLDAIRRFYGEFDAVTDEEVLRRLGDSRRASPLALAGK